MARAGGWDNQPGFTPRNEITDAQQRIWVVGDIPDHDLRGLDLRSSECWACNFAGCDLRGADLTGARLYACDFTGADLTGAVLTGATFDRFTRWPCPEGTRFDPQAHGARLEE